MPACARPGGYVPRQTHDCAAAVLVRRHLAGFLERLEENGHGPLPEFVKAELEGFAGCGDFVRGFVRTACRTCGDELRVPFACRGRGICPSGMGRRMAEGASRQGRYHNRRYKVLAEELGLTVAKHETYGWTLTATTPAVEEKYSAEITALQAAIDEQHGAHRRVALRTLEDESGEDGGNNGDKSDEDNDTRGRRAMIRQCACTPARTIKVRSAIYEQGYIICGVCARPFLTPEESDEPGARLRWLTTGQVARQQGEAKGPDVVVDRAVKPASIALP